MSGNAEPLLIMLAEQVVAELLSRLDAPAACDHDPQPSDVAEVADDE